MSHREPYNWMPDAFIVLLVMCLCYASLQAMRSWAEVAALEDRVFAQAMLLDHFSMPSRLIMPRPLDRIVPMEVIRPRKPRDKGHDTPIFSPEWHYEVGR